MYLLIYHHHPPRASKRRPHFNAIMERLDGIGAHRTAFEKNRKIILRTQNICGICGQPVDMSLKTPHPMSASVDHIIPISRGGHPSDLSNLQLAHRICNQVKKNRILVGRTASELQETKEINNDDLPLHYDWSSYVAT